MALWKSGVRVPSGPLYRLASIKRILTTLRKVGAVAKHKRNVWDELLEVGRRILKELDDFFDPKARQTREPARVPVPARRPSEAYRKK